MFPKPMYWVLFSFFFFLVAEMATEHNIYCILEVLSNSDNSETYIYVALTFFFPQILG